MVDKRVWSGAIAVVTLIVAGAGALPELLLRPASTAPTVIVSVTEPKAEAAARPKQTLAEVDGAPVPIDDTTKPTTPPKDAIAAAARPAAPAPEIPEPGPAAPEMPAPSPAVAFPPVQPVGVAAVSIPEALSPAHSPAAEVIPARPKIEKPPRPERTAWQPAKPKKSARPAVYPIGEFLAWRR